MTIKAHTFQELIQKLVSLESANVLRYRFKAVKRVNGEWQTLAEKI